MMDDPNLTDPALNFTRSENQAIGARIPEYHVRRLVETVLRKIRLDIDAPHNVIDELFAMHGDEVIKQIKGFIREHRNLPVMVNWPSLDMALPVICVVNLGEQEDSDFSFIGDRGGPYRVTSTPPTFVRETHIVGLRSELEVIIGTPDPNLTMYLHYIVKYAVFMNKDILATRFDIHNLVIGGKDLTLDPRFFPTFGYYKSVQLQFQTVFEMNAGPVSPLIVGTDLVVETLVDGEPGLTHVPGE